MKEDPPSHGWGAIITTGLNKYFPTDFWLFLYIYQLCYTSGPAVQKELSLASKLFEGLLKIESISSKKVGFKIHVKQNPEQLEPST
jgi:hypothetical protein